MGIGNRNSSALWSSAIFLVGLVVTVVPQCFLRQSVGACQDVAARGLIFATLSHSASLPIPIVQNCSDATWMFVCYYAGYLACAAGTLMLVQSRISGRGLAALSALAMGFAIAMPFSPNVDPYAYALSAYEPVVLKQTPYVVQNLDAGPKIARELATLFPARGNPIRVANYGPVFTAVYAAFIGPFGFLSLKAMLIAERFLGAACVLALGGLMALTQTTIAAKRSAFISIALNPLILFESVSFTHGDVIMLLFLAAAFLAYRSERIWLCAALCVLAMETRSVAATASVVLLWDLAATKRYRACVEAATSTMLTLLVTWLAANAVFGSFGHSTGFFYSSLNAPGTLVAALILGDTGQAVAVGLIVGAALAAAMAYVGLRERIYELVSLAVLIALPGVEPWYVQWLAPVTVVSSYPACKTAFVTFMLLAPLGMFIEMSQQHDYAAAHGAVVAIQWSAVVAAYLWAIRRRKPELALTR